MLFRILREATSRGRRKVRKTTDISLVARLTEAQAAVDSRDLGLAARLFSDILRDWPECIEALRGLGRVESMRGAPEVAESLLRRAVVLSPDHTDAWIDLGNVCLAAARYEPAASCYHRAIELDGGGIVAWYNLGLCRQRQGALAAAAFCFRHVLEHDPWFEKALRLWVGIQESLGCLEETRDVLEKLVVASPDHAEAHAALGYLLLKRFFQPQSALCYFEQALALGFEEAELYGNRGIALQDLGRLDEALASYEQALRLDSGNHGVRLHRSLARLARYDFAGGWPEYELRLAEGKGSQRRFPYPRWNGDNLAGKTLLVHGEQGLGDEIMFASCLPDVVARAGHCIVECHPKIAPLLRRSFPEIRVYARTQADDFGGLSELPPIDFCIPIGSLPLHFRRGLHEFPNHHGYLRADAERVEFWRKALRSLGTGLKVGLSWRGGTAQTRRRYRSLTLEQLLPILDVDGIQFVNLQYDDCSVEIEQLRAVHSRTLHHFPEALADYDETAALVTALDLVVSVCTAIIHLGGALGKPVWILTPLGAEWRYGSQVDFMPWYPSVRLFRQRKPEEWNGVLQDVAALLGEVATRSGVPKSSGTA